MGCSSSSFSRCFTAAAMPKDLPTMETAPSRTAMVGFSFVTAPRPAWKPLSRPPRRRYSRVSMTAKMRTLSFSRSTSPAMAAAGRPLSRSLQARLTRICIPAVALRLSTM